MNERQAVHTLARRYCQEQFSEWCGRYEALQREQPRSEGDYSLEAYNTFPRYLILQAILRAVETLTPENASSADLLVEAMATATQNADSNLTAAPQNAIAAAAIAEERDKFITYIRSLSVDDIDAPTPLPFRRTLVKNETDRIWAELKTKWGADGDYWYPLKSKDLPPGLLAFHTDYFDGVKEAVLRELLTRRRINRIWELREHSGDEYELELALFQPHYNGAEGYWTSAESDWLVYASHESSITLAGDWGMLVSRTWFQIATGISTAALSALRICVEPGSGMMPIRATNSPSENGHGFRASQSSVISSTD
ncbi:MAG: hypothetical protein M3Z54_06655 [Gemmatimonadota bacterium]|nr:hypothetical protein [Gemmatimonadota bacterium]